MEVKTLNGKVVKYYDSIDELPIINYQKFNKYILFSTSIGGDINALIKHHTNVLKLIDVDIAKAKIEINNTLQCLLFLDNQINPELLAFACLVYSINDDVITDYSDSNLKRIIDTLKEEKFSTVKKLLEQLKKKLNDELDAYYPEYFSTAKQQAINNSLLKQRTILLLKCVLARTDEDREKLNIQLKALDQKIIKQYKVYKFSGKDSYEIIFDKQFESSCLVIAQETGMSPYNLTVLQFYGLIENIQKQTKQKLKASKKHGK